MLTYLWPTGTVGRPWTFEPKGEGPPPDPTESTETLSLSPEMVVLVTVRDAPYDVGDHAYGAPRIRRAFSAPPVNRELRARKPNREFRG